MFAIRSLLPLVVALCCSVDLLNGEDSPIGVANYTVTLAAGSVNSNVSRDLATPTTSTTESTSTVAVSSTKSVAATTVSSFPATAKWNVSSDGFVCILLQSAIRITFGYIVQETGKYEKGVTDVPASAAADGVCDPKTQSVSLLFNDNWKLTVMFTLNDTEYYLSGAELSYDVRFGHFPFPTARSFANTSVYSVKDESDFKTTVGKSCICTSQSAILNDALPDSVGLLQVDLYDTRVEAFRGNNTSTDFSVMGDRCDNDELSLLVPIIVGACLAGLIVFVLVAYFIGRHRSKRGYLNV